MSAVRTVTAGRSQAAPGDTKKKVLLGILVVLMIGVLAFQVPRLMNRGSSTATPAEAPATEVAADGSVAAPPVAADPAAAATAATPAKGATVLAFRRLPARDPFVPLLGETSEVAPAAAAQAAASQPAPASAQASPAVAAEPVTSGPAAATDVPQVVTPLKATATAGKQKAAKAAPVSVEPVKVEPVEVEPTVAVIRANGKKQAVAVDQFFKTGDLWFQLVGLGPKSMEVAVVGGSFTGGRHTITVRLDHPVTLFNTATGVEYTLRLAQATTGVATTSSAEPVTAEPVPSAPATAPTEPTTTTATEPDPSATTTS